MLKLNIGSQAIPTLSKPVDGAHITFHPPQEMHFKGQRDRSQHDEDIFKGIAQVGIMLDQQEEVPWLRVTSKDLAHLPQAGPSRADQIDSEELVYTVPAPMIAASALVEIDFIRESDVDQDRAGPPWEFRWHEVGLRIRPRVVSPQIATLSWFHFYSVRGFDLSALLPIYHVRRARECRRTFPLAAVFF